LQLSAISRPIKIVIAFAKTFNINNLLEYFPIIFCFATAGL